MSRMEEFIAFRAAIALLKERGMQSFIDKTYETCKAQLDLPKEWVVNHVKEIYKPFTDKEIADKVAILLTPDNVQTKVEIVFQSLEGLHNACPNHSGDWYFSGDYPTPGGNKVVINAFIKYYESVLSATTYR